jgi:hypothetical protein
MGMELMSVYILETPFSLGTGIPISESSQGIEGLIL